MPWIPLRSAARQSYDKERFADFLVCDVGVKLPVPLHLQARAQCLQDIGPESDFSDQVQPCLALAGLEQARKRFKKVAFAEIIEAAASLCGLDQISRMRTGGWNSCFPQQCATSIQKPNRQQWSYLPESSDRGVHLVMASNGRIRGVGSLLDLRLMETKPRMASQAANGTERLVAQRE